MKNSPKSLYVHIPFCNHLCNYCDFCKMQYFEKFADDYLISLKKELDSYNIADLDTIYVGGGTPTSLNIVQLKSLLDMLAPYVKENVEYTFESNVETLDKEKLLLLKQYGVNRLSIGVESTNDEILKLINRHHSYQDVINNIKLCREIGFKNINLDLILGLPGTSLKDLENDINNLLTLNPEHISTYSLIVNPHTKFYNLHMKDMDQDSAREEYDLVDKKLRENGYIHYEVSNFGKPGYFSRHNFTYWDDKQYYGVGLGASGYIGNKRYKNTTSLTQYNKLKFIKEEEIVEEKDDLIYYLMLKLRTINGIDLVEFESKFNTNLLLKCPKTIDKYKKSNDLIINNDRIIPTYEGMMIMDSIVLDFLNEYDKR